MGIKTKTIGIRTLSGTAFAALLSGCTPQPTTIDLAMNPDRQQTAGAETTPAANCRIQIEKTNAGAGIDASAADSIVAANPDNYLALIPKLRPGDRMILAPGDYCVQTECRGLPLLSVNGTKDRPIVITGADFARKPRFFGNPNQHTIQLANSSYIVVRNLEIDGRDAGKAAVAAIGPTHHILIEGLTIRGVGNSQQTVGISASRSPSWHWTIRANKIFNAGTGMYLGNSDGTNPFVAGLIEENSITDTLGYNLQIKHQKVRPNILGMPTGPSKTVIRRNFFGKSTNSSIEELARPNVLVGHLPPSGSGVNDLYEIYGNLFWQNPTEALFQGEGNLALYS